MQGGSFLAIADPSGRKLPTTWAKTICRLCPLAENFRIMNGKSGNWKKYIRRNYVGYRSISPFWGNATISFGFGLSLPVLSIDLH